MKNKEKLLTYCNPLSIPEVPKGTDPEYTDIMTVFTHEEQKDYRSISDPSVLYHDGKWYLYPSYGMAFVSEDFATWKHHRTNPYNMKYSPVVVPFKGRFLMTSHSNGLYISDSPLGDFEFLGDFIKPDGSAFRPTDPGLFVDDDGRLYLYCFDVRESEHKRAYITGTYGVELDTENPRKLKTDLKMIFEFNGDNEWERFGAKRQDTLCGWLEGQWMIKIGKRYYLIYASAGTEFPNYSMAAYISDEGPLDGFRLQKHNPITESHSNIVSGAGHGCVAKGPNDTLWAFYTVAITYNHMYERCIGMDLMALNEDGELYCPHGITDTPQFAAGQVADPVKNNTPGWLPLTVRQRGMVRVSSAVPGHESFYALDESMLTFWQPREDDEKPTITVNLQAPYNVSAMRVIWRDIGLDYENGAVPGPYQYILEGCPDADFDEWVTLVDCSKNETDLNIDYKTFDTASVELVRLTILGHPQKISPAVVDFTVFGNRDESL